MEDAEDGLSKECLACAAVKGYLCQPPCTECS